MFCLDQEAAMNLVKAEGLGLIELEEGFSAL